MEFKSLKNYFEWSAIKQ